MKPKVTKLNVTIQQLTTTIPAAEINKEFNARFDRLRRTLKLNGYRPGKVPLSVVRSKCTIDVANSVREHFQLNFAKKTINNSDQILASVPKISELSPCAEDQDYTLAIELALSNFEIENDDYKHIDVEIDEEKELGLPDENSPIFKNILERAHTMEKDAAVDINDERQRVYFKMESERVANKILKGPYIKNSYIDLRFQGNEEIRQLINGMKVGESKISENIPSQWFDDSPIVLELAKVTIQKIDALQLVEVTDEVASDMDYPDAETYLNDKQNNYVSDYIYDHTNVWLMKVLQTFGDLYPIDLDDESLYALAIETRDMVVKKYPLMDENYFQYLLETYLEIKLVETKNQIRFLAIAKRERMALTMEEIASGEDSLSGKQRSELNAIKENPINFFFTLYQMVMADKALDYLLELPMPSREAIPIVAHEST
jgi:FKBP-type peptidyl-prolyl cis-trans isomerase (trigger factor)